METISALLSDEASTSQSPVPEDVFVAPASFAQRRLWFLHQLDPTSTAYNITLAVRFEGRLVFAALEQSFNEIVRRHKSLRTSFRMIDEELMQVIEPHQQLHIRRIDLQAVPDDDRKEEIRRQIRLASERPFDFEKSESLRLKLLDLSDRESVLVLVMNHICSDGWSLGVLVKEMVALYEAFTEGRRSPLPELEIQYLDFAQWQREWLSGSVHDEQLGFWKRTLGGKLPVLDLSGHTNRQMRRTSRGATELLRLPAELSKQLKKLGREHRATPFMVFLTVFQVLLQRYTGLDDILVGTPVAGRTRPETRNLIGFFVNTLVMRTDLSGDPRFVDLLARVVENTLEALMNSDIPFEMLVEELHPERNLAQTQIFQVMFVMQNTPAPDINLKDLRVSIVGVEETTAKFDLLLSLRENASGFTGSFQYSTECFTHARIQRFARHFRQLLEAIVVNPEARVSALPLLTEDEKHQLLVEWNDTARTNPGDHCLHTFFEEQAARTPDRVALVYEDQQLTYAQLNQRANQLAHHLRRLDVGPETFVAICLERSLEMVVGVLGILKAGGVYVPLDPSDPQQRLSFTLSDSQAPVLLTQASLAVNFVGQRARVLCLDTDWNVISGESEENPAVAIGPDNLAYVIYTSGSTGQPKGVLVTHGAINNHMLWKRENTPLTATDRVLQKTSFTFDASISEFFLPLMCGAQLVLARPYGHQDSAYLVETMAQQEITLVHLVPTMLRAVLAEKDISRCRSLRRVFCGGEPFTPDLRERFFSVFAEAELYIMYGPTEAAVDVTYWPCERGSEDSYVLLGRPLHNVQLYVLDTQLRPVPIGVTGELYLGGINLARGYLNRPELTAERFIPNPFSATPGTRLYRTGDLVRYLEDSRLEFLGRRDSQVKLRGFRIELGEIESVLDQHESVRACVVLARQGRTGEKILVAYVVPKDGQTVVTAELRQYLNERLPSYMIPTTFVSLEALPLLSSGKVDRKALPAPEDMTVAARREYVSPRTQFEELLASAWAKVLKIDRVSVDDNFFDLGGHSLLATRVISRINEVYPQAVSLRNLFEKPVLSEFALLIEQAQSGQSVTGASITAQPRKGKNRARLLEHL
ncbi:MAG TPA: amino acid adenylation domain-containing protein, partial [Pyrinomonadaceae bacterium]|nr:amino acid adenylation domain-containing protein [Pyrinomonadaceae bacterium]